MRLFAVLPIFVAAFGLLLLIAFRSGTTKFTHFHSFPMSPFTAVALVLQGFAQFLIGRMTYQARLIACVLAVSIIGTMHGLLIIQAVIAFSSAESQARMLTQNMPVLPSLGTMLSFMLLSSVVLLYQFRAPMLTLVGLHLFVVVLGALALLGHVIGDSRLYWYSERMSVAMAPHTAFLLILLGAWGVWRIRALDAEDKKRTPTVP